jgi:hypothetical protein
MADDVAFWILTNLHGVTVHKNTITILIALRTWYLTHRRTVRPGFDFRQGMDFLSYFEFRPFVGPPSLQSNSYCVLFHWGSRLIPQLVPRSYVEFAFTPPHFMACISIVKVHLSLTRNQAPRHADGCTEGDVATDHTRDISNIVVEWLTLLLRIWEVPCSILSPGDRLSWPSFCGLSQSLRVNAGIIP